MLAIRRPPRISEQRIFFILQLMYLKVYVFISIMSRLCFYLNSVCYVLDIQESTFRRYLKHEKSSCFIDSRLEFANLFGCSVVCDNFVAL